VELGGHPAYEVTHRGAVPLQQFRGLVRGEHVGVRIDPEEPERLEIDWAR